MRIINLSLNKLKLIVKIRCIKGYKNLSKERLLSALNKSELVESEENFHDAKKKKSKKILMSYEINEIRRNRYEIKNKTNVLTQKIKELKKIFVN